MVRFLLVAAAVVFIIWLALTLIGAVFGGLIHLLWIVILIALAVWAVRALTGRGRSRSHSRML